MDGCVQRAQRKNELKCACMLQFNLRSLVKWARHNRNTTAGWSTQRIQPIGDATDEARSAACERLARLCFLSGRERLCDLYHHRRSINPTIHTHEVADTSSLADDMKVYTTSVQEMAGSWRTEQGDNGEVADIARLGNGTTDTSKTAATSLGK